MARKKAKALPLRMITVYAEILQETEKAILVRCEGDADGEWLPKSQIKYSGERGDTGVEIEIPELLADEKGFFDGMGRPEVEAAPAPAEVERECHTCKHSDGDCATDCEPCRACDEVPAGKRAFGDNVKWLKEEKITVTQPLSESEKARYAEEMAALDKEIEELEDERAAVSSRLKKQIDAMEQERREMSAHVNEGELRTISCDCLKDYTTGEMVWTKAYPPYAEVQRRKMTKEEMQPSLLEYSEKMNAGTPAEDGAENEAPADAATEEDAPGCTSCAHQDCGDDESCDGCDDDRGNYTPIAAATEAAGQGVGAV